MIQNMKVFIISDFQPGLRMHEGKTAAVRVAALIFLLYTFVGVSAHISAVLMVRKNTENNTFIGNVTCESFIPYIYDHPFDVSTATGCYYSLAWMDFALDINANYIAALDLIFVTLMHCLTCQLNILGEAFTSIRQRCLRKLNLENANFLHDTEYPKLEEAIYEEFSRCTKHLYSLIEVRNDIEDVFTFITLGQTIGSLLIFASCLFVASKEPITSPNFFSQMEYFSAVLFQFSLYCWFGNQMTIAGASISTAVYNSDWFACSKRVKKSIILTMSRMQRPVFVSIGKFTPLTLTTLLAVIKGSFSYYTVFQSAGE
ncbi:putative odorant receptor 92a isoform X2 [Anthonomus grandis grandis]|uniref:putative odorant receptor 92a isoform X2 n=1 Tax=Anthonomus grandis grandis TaxID=2921223 RepID=UPI0021660D8E|nr:putative odorant receptor 92a isoform X2 [Anthonomus grandis grandis]